MQAVLWLTFIGTVSACGRVDFASVDAATTGVTDAIVDDAAEICMQSPCQLVLPQCGCGAAQMCQRTGATTDQRGCVARGTLAADEQCTLDAQCVEGYACLSADGVTGRCHRYCAGDGDCAAGLQCAKYQEGVGIGMCGSTCTLEGGCPPGSACKVILVYDFDSTNPVAMPTCTAPAGSAAGSSCTSSIDCAAGLFCDEGNVCRTMCRMDGTLPCTTGTCMAALAPIFLGGVEHGFCR